MDFYIYRLGNLFTRFSSGKNLTSEKIFDKGEYPVYGGNGLRGYTSEYNFDGECIIIGRQGAKCGNIHYFNGKGYMTDHAIVGVSKNGHDSRFLSYALTALDLNRLSGQAAQPGLAVSMLKKQKIQLPSSENQFRIAEIISAYDNLIENNNKQIKLLEQIAENLYKEWFVRFRFPGHEDVKFNGSVPSGWQYRPISESVIFYDSQRVPLSSMERDKMDKIYPYYGAAKLMDYVDDYLFDGEYLLMGEDGTVITSDGFPVLQLVNGKFWVNNHAHVIGGKGDISTRFLYLTFSRFPITGVVTGSAQPKISKGRLEKLKILVPEVKIMEQFSNLINPIFDEINLLKKQLIKITKQRDMLLPRLMSGKIEV